NGCCPFLQRVAGDLFGVGPRVREPDRELKRARADADLGSDGYVAWTRAVIKVGQPAVCVVKLDVDVRAAVVAGGGAAERADDADPHVLLAQEEGWRMRIQDLAEVALGAWLPVRRRL